MNSHFNTYGINAELAQRRSQIRNDYSPRNGTVSRSGRHLFLPKLPSLPKIRFHRPTVTA